MSNVELQTSTHFTSCVFTGTIVSKTYGVAKKAKAVSVRVLDEDGSGSIKYDKNCDIVLLKFLFLILLEQL